MPDATETKVRGRTGAIGVSGKAGRHPGHKFVAAKKPAPAGIGDPSSVPTCHLDEADQTIWTSTAVPPLPGDHSFPARSSWSPMIAI